MALLLMSAMAFAQTPPQSAVKKTAPHRAHELTLAGLQPGRDSSSRASTLYKKWPAVNSGQERQLEWHDSCRGQQLTVDLDSAKKIEVIRLSKSYRIGDCSPETRATPWKTGKGLRVGDSSEHGLELYGEPDSRSPSTKDGQPLELWYYAFDWAGPDVPQVMEVLCTKAKEGEPGRVVEITLAAPSL